MTSPELFKRGMRRLASGVSIITTLDMDCPHGFIATSVTSVSAEPAPSLLICVNRSVSCHGALLRAGVFCVNLLDETQAEIAGLFSSSLHRQRRFSETEWRILATGSPALPGSLASFDCEVQETLDVQTHTIFIARVVRVELWERAVRPLLYVDGRFEALRPLAAVAA